MMLLLVHGIMGQQGYMAIHQHQLMIGMSSIALMDQAP
jgi:hypothetical protein